MQRKILIFNTYPIVAPQHGGQKRAAAIVDKYRTLGHQVRYVGVFTRDAYKKRGAHDVIITNQASLDHMNAANAELVGDLATGWISRDDKSIYEALIKNIVAFKPDTIEIEHPFMLPFINKARDEGYISWQKFIYSAHNVEWRMKRAMFEDAGLATERTKELSEQIYRLEEHAVALADIVIVVTDDDKEEFATMGAKKTIVAPNGINSAYTTQRSLERLRNIYQKKGIKKNIVFVGSWHQPNWQGFLDNVSTGLGFLPHDTKIIVVGGIVGLIEQYFADKSIVDRVCFMQRTLLLGKVSEEMLGAVLVLADEIILPISSGGGSNLKTAEAILSKKPTVATLYAMRGYDAYMKLPNMHTAKNRKDFQGKMLSSLNNERVNHYSKAETQLSQRVAWVNVLDKLKEV
tara:strand:- start:14090 stop:15301 length:1212 start_codon:yes stop_codon:yes gene_type:complete